MNNHIKPFFGFNQFICLNSLYTKKCENLPGVMCLVFDYDGGSFEKISNTNHITYFCDDCWNLVKNSMYRFYSRLG